MARIVSPGWHRSVAAEMSLPYGFDLGGYRIVSELGHGGMATVYRAVQTALDREVAVKVLPAALAADPGFKSRFQQEARAVAQLRHPNIVDVHDYGDSGGNAYIVTEFISGGTLEGRLGTPLPVEEVVALLTPVASALDHAHRHGILHRDVKPSNILVSAEGVPILSDFGLLRMLGKSASMTETGMVMGTPDYMAPEQCAGERLGPGADIYALATVAFQLLTGVLPFTGDTPMKVIVAKLKEPAVRARAIRPDLTPKVESVLLRGMALNPDQRFASAGSFIDALAGRGDPLADSTVLIRSALKAFRMRSATFARNPASYALVGALLLLAGIVALTQVPPRPLVRGPAPLAAAFTGDHLLLQNNPQSFVVDGRLTMPGPLPAGTPVLVKADGYSPNRVIVLAVYGAHGAITTYSVPDDLAGREAAAAGDWEAGSALTAGTGVLILVVSTLVFALRERRRKDLR